MGKIFISPAVVTNEVDKSYLPAAVGQIGAAYIGKMPYGPAFVPYQAQTYTDASNIFGDLDEDYPMTYGVRSYMRNAPQCTIVRVLGPSGRVVNGQAVTPGYLADSMWGVTSVSGGVGYVHALIEITGSQSLSITDLSNDLFYVNITSRASNGETDSITVGTLNLSGTYNIGIGGSNYGYLPGTGDNAQTILGYLKAQIMSGSPPGIASMSVTGSGASASLIINFTGAPNYSGTPDPKLVVTTTIPQFVAPSGSNSLVAATCSMLTASPNYIGKVLNSDPTQYSNIGYWLRETYDYITPALNNGASIFSALSYANTDFRVGYNSGSTPWVTSQVYGGNTIVNLFKFHTIGHGEAENGRFKVSISNITPSPSPVVQPFGKFDVEIRLFSDTDRVPVVVESFPGCDLDPTSTDYLPLRIGDRFSVFDNTKGKVVFYGNYTNASNYVRVEMTPGSYPNDTLPWGFRGLVKPTLNVTGSNGLIDLPYVKNLLDKETQSEAQDYIFWGIETQLSGNIASRFSFMPGLGARDADFSLTYVSGNIDGNLTYVSGTANTKSPGSTFTPSTLDPAHAQFTVPIAFGFDGWDYRLVDPTQNETQCLTANQLGTQAIRQGLDVVSDPDFIDINMIVIPGFWAPPVVNYGINIVEARADAFYIAELSGTDATTQASHMQTLGYQSNYASAYYPPVKIVDPNNNKIVTIPSSVVAGAAVSYSDRVSQPWYAPAGLTRGALNLDTIGFTVVEALDRLTQSERDTLYQYRINPIASFPSEGVVIWGQKTMQLKSSALDRVNVRRLLIKAKKFIASVGKALLFEPNNASTWTKFKQQVNPYLLDIQTKNGLQQFLVVMDETTNTPDLIDRNQMAGTVFLQPTRIAETLTIDFVVTRTGATFSQ